MTTAMDDPILNVEESAAYIGRHPNYVRGLFRAGTIPAIGGGKGRPWGTTRSALNKYVQDQMDAA